MAMENLNFFEQKLEKYLEARAKVDPLFREKYPNEKKSVKECAQFVIEQVAESKRNGFDDLEIYNYAVHYYDEPDLKPKGKKIEGRIVMNAAQELTDEQKAKIQKEAEEEYKRQCLEKLKKKDEKPQKAAKKTAKPQKAEKVGDSQPEEKETAQKPQNEVRQLSLF